MLAEADQGGETGQHAEDEQRTDGEFHHGDGPAEQAPVVQHQASDRAQSRDACPVLPTGLVLEDFELQDEARRIAVDEVRDVRAHLDPAETKELGEPVREQQDAHEDA